LGTLVGSALPARANQAELVGFLGAVVFVYIKEYAFRAKKSFPYKMGENSF